MSAEATIKLTLIDRVTESVKRIEGRFKAMQARLGFDRLAKSAQRFSKALGGVGEGLARAGKRIGMLTSAIGLGAGGLVAVTAGLVKHTADLGDEIAKTSRQIGIGAVSLQEYRYAAKMSGVQQDALEKGMKKFGINAADATGRNKLMREEFDKLGVTLTDNNGQLKSMDQLFNESVSQLAKIKSPLERNRTAFVLFGKSGVEMTKMMEGGVDGINALRQEAHDTGAILGQDAANFAEVLGDNMSRLQDRFQGIRNYIGVQLMPIFNKVVVAVTAWIDANKDLLRLKIGEWVKRIGNVVRDLLNPASDLRKRISEIAEGFQSFAAFLKPIIERLGVFNSALIVIGAYIGGPLILSVLTAGAAFGKLVAAIMTIPFSWVALGIVAVVAAIAAVVYVLYKRWDDFLGYWTGLWGRVTDAFHRGFLTGILTALAEFNPLVHIARGLDAVLSYFTGFSLLDAGAAVVDSFLDGLRSKWDGVVSWLKGALVNLTGWLPKSIQSQLGIGVEVASTASKLGASVGRSASVSVPSVSAIPPAVSAAPRIDAARESISTPVSVNRGTTIDASTRIGELTIKAPPGGDAKAIAAEVRKALDERDAAKRTAMNSSLSD